MPDLRRTPLYDFNVAHGGQMVDFAGWEMPVQFRSIIEECKATRQTAGLFDVSHMGEARVKGADAVAYLDVLLSNCIAPMEKGRVLYSLMCNEKGGVIDDLLVYRVDETDFLLCINASNTKKDISWMQEKASGFDVIVDDVSEDYALLALQGPRSLKILQSLTQAPLDSLAYYWFVHGNVADIPCMISRTGYTGERGVELFVAPSEAIRLAEALLEEDEGLELIGLGARDALRLEAGYALHGHEISEEISPAQAGLMWATRLSKKSDFVGKRALRKEKNEGPARRVVFFRTDSRRIARPGMPVVCCGERVGHVLSGTFSPSLGEAIGSALVASNAASDELAVDMRGKLARIYPVKPPFLPLDPRK